LASPVEELRSAVEAVTAELGNGAVTPTLEASKRTQSLKTSAASGNILLSTRGETMPRNGLLRVIDVPSSFAESYRDRRRYRLPL